MSSLVIVESPGKRQSIQKYLDSISPRTYTVMASVGHICDLPLKELGFDTDTFQARYEIYENKKDVVMGLRAQAKRSDSVILAMDNDREGEAIAAHLQRELHLKNPDRIVFTEITQDAIRNAINNPRKINTKLVDSQEVRRLLDRMIGWLVSPVARTYVVPESSMGRVQTVVVLLLVMLERTIRDFKSTDHFGAEAYFVDATSGSPWMANWDVSQWLKDGQQYWTDEASATVVTNIKNMRVTSVEDGKATKAPSAPFITSTLQRAAQKNLKFKPKQTMELAQKLYEAGAITYMRTDNPNLSVDAFVALSSFANKNDLPIESTLRTFKTKASAQQAHEAIRPTKFDILSVTDGDSDLQKLYSLIWNRAVASQLKPAEYITKEVILEQDVQIHIDGQLQGKTATFKAKGRKLVSEGWLCMTKKSSFSENEEDEENGLNNPIPSTVKAGDVIDVSSCQLKRKRTQPPKRLTSSALIERLETLGIGRPSTFASIIETVETRGYITYQKDLIHVTDRGFKIIDEMEHSFKFIDIEYTAQMESYLDEIETGRPWFPFAKQFWDEINTEVKSFVEGAIAKLPQHKCEVCESLVIKTTTQKGSYWRCSNPECKARYSDSNDKPHVRQISEVTDFECYDCAAKLVYRKGSYNGRPYEYFACSRQRDQEDPCYAKYDLIKDQQPPTPDVELYKQRSKFKCLECGRPLVARIAKKGTPEEFTFWPCTGNTKENPSCKAMYSDKDGSPNFDLYEKSHEHKCPNCKKYITCREDKTTGENRWYCSNKKCGWKFEDVSDAPNTQAATEKYTEKCPECKYGALESFVSKKGDTFWRCTSQTCDAFMRDADGKPDLEEFESKKELGNAKGAKGGRTADSNPRGRTIKSGNGVTMSFKK